MTEPRPFTYEHYRAILGSALAAGYRFTGFDELEQASREDGFLCLLRHDCDNDLLAAAQMARIEREMGIRSTYFVMLRSAMYNLMAPTNGSLVREILGLGHWLGLHFDERALAAMAEEAIPHLVDREREWIEKEFRHPIQVVSFHQPSRRVLDGRIKLTCPNTYDKQDMAGWHYVSDSNLTFRNGDPIRLFRDRLHRKVQILLHPEWWTEEPMSLTGKWDEMLTHNFDLMQQSLLSREETYRERSEILFRRLSDAKRG